jgi:hypothetical protein
MPYFSTATTDDVDTVTRDYDAPDGAATIAYVLSTSLGMIGLIVAMLGGVEIGVVAMLLGVDMTAAVWLAVIGAIFVFVLLLAGTGLRIQRNQARLEARFPARPESAAMPRREETSR